MIEQMKNDLIKISLNSHKELIESIKSIKEKKFNPIERSWVIHKKHLSEVINKINDQSISDKLSNISRIPLNHQEQAKEFLLENKKSILADDMGGGKTFSSIIAGCEVKGKKLVVCPASLKYNWKKEIGLATSENVEIIEKSWISIGRNEWSIINYDLLEKYKDEVLKEGFSCIIVDEAHYVRSIDKKGNPKSIRAKMMMDICKDIEYVFLLTGTPIVNKNKDIFNLLRIVEHPIANNYTEFFLRYSNKNQEVLYYRLKFKMLRRLKHEFVDLPQKDRRFIPVKINLDEYSKLSSQYQIAKNTNEKNNYLVLINKMRQIIAREKVSHTIKLADDLIDKGKPVVIFTNYDYVVNEVMSHYEDNVVKVTGKDSGKAREEAVNRFQNGEVDVIVCNLIAGSEGLTLIRSSDLIVNDLDWNPSRHMQCEDRIHRIGQDKRVSIYYMYSLDTMDEKMSRMLEYKLKNINHSIDGKEDSSFMDDFIENI